MSNQTSTHTGRILVTGLTATGTNQATALPLPGRSDSIVEFTTVPANTGALLPPINLPMRVEIYNAGANTLAVYPQPGSTVNNGTANAATNLSAGNALIFEASSLTNWYVVANTASASAGSGTVTSVSWTGDGTIFTASPDTPVTTSGSLSPLGLISQSANRVFAGPSSGGATAPTFRALAVADLPAIASNDLLANTTGSAAAPAAVTLTSLIDAAIGNTQGDILYRGAANWSVLAPGASGTFLECNGAAANPSWGTPSGGGGGSGTVNSGTSGQVAYYGATGTAVSGESLAALMGTALGNTQGDILYCGAGGWTVLAPGSNGQFLECGGSGANPSWGSPSGSGTVNSGTSGQVAYYGATGTAVSGESLASLMGTALGNTQGDVLYCGASGWTVLAPGSSGQFLQTQGGSANPQWASASGSGTVSSGTTTLLAYYSGATTVSSGANIGYDTTNDCLQFTAQSTPGSPSAGDKWYDSTQLCLASYLNGQKGFQPRVLFRQVTAVTVSDTAGSSTLISTTSAVGSHTGINLNVVGKTLRITAAMILSTASSGNPNAYVFCKLGSTCVATSGTVGLPNSAANAPFTIEFDIMCTAVDSGSGGTVSVNPNKYTYLLDAAGTSFGNGSTPGTVTSQNPTAGVTLAGGVTVDFQVNFASAVSGVSVTLMSFQIMELC